MFGAVNAAVVRPRPSLPWQVAQPPPIMPPMPPPPILPPPAALPLRGMPAPLASRPVWKMTSPRETDDAPAAGASSVSRGEVIFQTGRDASGAGIPRNGSAAGGGRMG